MNESTCPKGEVMVYSESIVLFVISSCTIRVILLTYERLEFDVLFSCIGHMKGFRIVRFYL